MTSIEHLNIAVIGDEDLVNGLRLAGVNRYRVIEDNQDAGENARKALAELIGEPEISIIAIQEDYNEHVADLIKQVQEGPSLTPVIIEVPSKHGTKYADVNNYYKAYIRRFVGFDIEI